MYAFTGRVNFDTRRKVLEFLVLSVAWPPHTLNKSIPWWSLWSQERRFSSFFSAKKKRKKGLFKSVKSVERLSAQSQVLTTPFFPNQPQANEKKSVFPYVCTSWPLLGPPSPVFISLLLLPSPFRDIIIYWPSPPHNHPHRPHTSQPPNSNRPRAAAVGGQGGGGPKGLSESAEKQD